MPCWWINPFFWVFWVFFLKLNLFSTKPSVADQVLMFRSALQWSECTKWQMGMLMIHWIYLCVNTTSPENSSPRGIWNLKFVFSAACSVVQIQGALAVRGQMGEPSVMPVWAPERVIFAFLLLPVLSALAAMANNSTYRLCWFWTATAKSAPVHCDVVCLTWEFSPVCGHLSPPGRDENILCYGKLLGAWHPLPAVNLWPLPAAPRQPREALALTTSNTLLCNLNKFEKCHF